MKDWLRYAKFVATILKQAISQFIFSIGTYQSNAPINSKLQHPPLKKILYNLWRPFFVSHKGPISFFKLSNLVQTLVISNFGAPPPKKSLETWQFGFNFNHPTQAKVKFSTPGRFSCQIPHSPGTENSEMPWVCSGRCWLVHNGWGKNASVCQKCSGTLFFFIITTCNSTTAVHLKFKWSKLIFVTEFCSEFTFLWKLPLSDDSPFKLIAYGFLPARVYWIIEKTSNK